MHYNKPPLKLSEQIAKLKARGMYFADKQAAERILARLNYYRLTAYWYPFYADARRHQFKRGTDFDTVVSHYEFDRRLRLRVMDAIERFEIALRTQFAYQLAHRHGPLAYEDSRLYAGTAKHSRRLASLDREIQRSQEPFVLHHKRKYSTPRRPPIWIACEVMSLGLLSGLFDTLRQRVDRKAVAKDFGLDELVLRSFAHHITFIRNICAHHRRLWNRDFAITTKLPKAADPGLITSLALEYPQKIYNTLVLLGFLLNKISDDARWRGQLVRLLHEHPVIDLSAMGFPTDWRERTFCKTITRINNGH